jgi:hypothetical protein
MASPPVIDYTDKDYASLRRALLDLAQYRLPEWTDRSANDLGALMVDLFAYVGDVVLYYQDRIANESFLHTAAERRSVLHLLRLIGYELAPPVAASATLRLTFDAPESGDPTTVTIAEGTQFQATLPSGQQLTFEYLGADLPIDLSDTSTQVTITSEGDRVYNGLPVRHSRRVGPETLGTSTGEPNQQFALQQSPLIRESIVVEVDEGAGYVEWTRRDTLLYHVDATGRVVLSGSEDRVYYVQFDEANQAAVVFGDGTYGRRPPSGSRIRATYRVGGGTVGNVPAGSIQRALTTIDGLSDVRNEQPAAGGTEAESMEHAVRFGPQVFRSSYRAVTLRDYEALAHQAGGVAKVRARARGLNAVDLFVAPEGDTCRPVPENLKKHLIAFFEDKRMAGSVVYIEDAVCIPVDISVEVIAAHHYEPEGVRQNVEQAIRALLDFAAVDFGQTIYLSKVYESLEALDGVHAVTVTRFRIAGRIDPGIQEVLDSFGVTTVGALPGAVRRTLQVDVASGGRIDMGSFEIPSLGELSTTVREELA